MLRTLIRLTVTAAFVAWISAWINNRRLAKQDKIIIPPLTAEDHIEDKK